ncbi:Os05g0463800, partial [Oryza sativa Japonica Group]
RRPSRPTGRSPRTPRRPCRSASPSSSPSSPARRAINARGRSARPSTATTCCGRWPRWASRTTSSPSRSTCRSTERCGDSKLTAKAGDGSVKKDVLGSHGGSSSSAQGMGQQAAYNQGMGYMQPQYHNGDVSN